MLAASLKEEFTQLPEPSRFGFMLIWWRLKTFTTGSRCNPSGRKTEARMSGQLPDFNLGNSLSCRNGTDSSAHQFCYVF